MTKAELLNVLSDFSDDIEIYVSGCEPLVFYLPTCASPLPGTVAEPAHILLEAEGWTDDPEVPHVRLA